MSEKDLISAFEFIGQEPSSIIIKKCLEICSTYNIDAEELVEHWSAFSMTHLKNAAISLEGITLMIQRTLNNKKSTNTAQELNPEKSKSQKGDTSKKPITKVKKSEILENVSPELEISKNNPEHENLRPQCDNNDEDVDRISYTNRTDSGKVVMSFGKNHNYVPNDQLLKINICGSSDWYKPEIFTALYTTQTRIASCFSKKIDLIGQDILKVNNLEVSENEGHVIVYGRIKSENQDKINNKSVILETSRDFNGPKEITLNISNTQNYSIFSGQIVAVKGIKSSRNLLIVQELYCNAPLNFTYELPTFNESLLIVAAAGPFTICNNFLYEPLQDLLKCVVQEKPNILILIGPFIDADHNNLLSITETFEKYFEILIKNIMECLVGWPIQVVLVPSSNDAHHFPIFPTPCYMLKYQNVICAPNPCILNINGFTIGTTSLDILFQLTKEEISRNAQNKDRMNRLVSHLMNQRSFYPLYPNRDTSLAVDYERLINDCTIDVKPHLLILPSTLRHFIKNVNNCLVVNPERLVKRHIGGTYATISVKPSLKAESMIDNISCQIRNI